MQVHPMFADGELLAAIRLILFVVAGSIALATAGFFLRKKWGEKGALIFILGILVCSAIATALNAYWRSRSF
jgi:hypothetical protein